MLYIILLLNFICINALFSINNNYIVDEYNRVQLFHGINRIKKERV